MATVNLGRIRQVWRGTWATGTAYVKDDVVQEGVNSYICTTAHTAGATFAGDSSNWELMVQGAEIPSQTGNAGSFLTTDGTDLSWGNSDYVKLIDSYGGATGVIGLPSLFNDNPEYRRYEVMFECLANSSGQNVRMRFSDASNNYISSNSYDYVAHATYYGNSNGTTLTGAMPAASFRIHDFSVGTNEYSRFRFTITNVGSGETDMEAGYVGNYFVSENSNTYNVTGSMGGNIRYNGVVGGFQLFMSSGDFALHRLAVYGIR